MQKFEAIYDGETFIFESDEIPVLFEISEKLKITKFPVLYNGSPSSMVASKAKISINKKT